MGFELRDYQQECVELVVASYANNPSDEELVVLPCGAGKTVIFSEITAELNRRHGVNALVVAHRDELLDQAAEKYRNAKPGAIVGKVGGGVHEYGGEVTVAGVMTVSGAKHIKRLKALYGTGKGLLIIIDEAHHVVARSYQVVLEALPDAFVLKVTATPDRLDKKPISTKLAIFSRSIIWMIEQKYLCDARAIAIRTEVSLDEIRNMAGDFNERELDLAINTPTRNKRVVDAYQEHANGKRAICFGVTVNHAEALAYMFNEHGVNAAVVEGDTPIEERKRIYEAFRRGEILIICNVLVLTEGFDEPLVECVIMARPTQSRALYIQCFGRGLRLAEGKKECIVLDLTDNCLKHKITPINLKRAIDINMKDGESAEEALARVEKEQEDAREKQAQIRKLKETRKKDVIVNLLEKMEWKEGKDGMYILEVGIEKHRLAIVPCPSVELFPQYDIWARLAPDFKAQKWLGGQTLEDCVEHANKKARMIMSEPQSAKWLDKLSPRQQELATEKQKQFLDWKKISYQDNITKGEAGDLIDNWVMEQNKRMAAKAARKAQREEHAS